LVADAYLLYCLYPSMAWEEAWRLILLAVPGVGLGSFGLTYLEGPTLKAGLGVLLIAYVLIAFFQPKDAKAYHWPWGMVYGVGLAGGSLSGLIGIGGPPVVAYLQSRKLPKAKFRATCVGVFLLFDLTRLGSYSAQGLLDTQAGLKGLALIPAFFAGTVAGFKLHEVVPEQRFQSLIYLMLLGIGLSLLRAWF
jgi:Sulfite exporter TauE/SafE.